jgi:hypothetical protein
LENTPLGGGGISADVQLMSSGGKSVKKEREKGGKYKRKCKRKEKG